MEKVVIRGVGGGRVYVFKTQCIKFSKKSIKLLFSKDTERGKNQLKLFS